MGEVLAFSVAAFFMGALGLVIGGPLRLIFSGELKGAEAFAAGFYTLPPFIAVVSLFLLKLDDLGGLEWGLIVGLGAGGGFSFYGAGKSSEEIFGKKADQDEGGDT